MNFSHKELVRINFRHSYFLDGIPNCFSVKPTIETERFFLNNNLLFKNKNSHFIIAYESFNNGIERTMEDVLELNAILRFTITLTDSLFFNYTSISTSDISNSIFHFHNFNEDKRQFLHSDENVLLKDLVSVSNFDFNFFIKPFALIELQLNNIHSKEYIINFKEKQTHWRYLIVSEHLKDLSEPAVIGPTAFNGPIEIILPDSKTALSFESTIPIGIKQRSEQSFQLVENYNLSSNKGKIVIKNLPQPNVNNISKIRDEGQNEYSEIII
jgi:hypothetical protein